MEEGLFPHMRSLDSKAAMEEERRLCYVGMTRSEKRLVLTSARYRRRFGGGQQEATIPSRFLREVPRALVEDLGQSRQRPVPQVDLFTEQYEVREAAKRNLYTGKTYNSVENIQQFFNERGKAATPATSHQPPAAPPPIANPQSRPAVVGRTRGFRAGATIRHPKYGRGTVLRREGDGEDAKLTVSFPGYGLKKLVEKYAGIQED
jgi:DNA helicase-2/ATP-dependent DNA helicase PcrA